MDIKLYLEVEINERYKLKTIFKKFRKNAIAIVITRNLSKKKLRNSQNVVRGSGSAHIV